MRNFPLIPSRRAGIDDDELAGGDGSFARDAESLRGCVPEIMSAAGRLLGRVKAGELATAPGNGAGGAPLISARVGWL